MALFARRLLSFARLFFPFADQPRTFLPVGTTLHSPTPILTSITLHSLLARLKQSSSLFSSHPSPIQHLPLLFLTSSCSNLLSSLGNNNNNNNPALLAPPLPRTTTAVDLSPQYPHRGVEFGKRGRRARRRRQRRRHRRRGRKRACCARAKKAPAALSLSISLSFFLSLAGSSSGIDFYARELRTPAGARVVAAAAVAVVVVVVVGAARADGAAAAAACCV